MRNRFRRIGKTTRRSGWLTKIRGVGFEPVPWVGDRHFAAAVGVLKSLDVRMRGEREASPRLGERGAGGLGLRTVSGVRKR